MFSYISNMSVQRSTQITFGRDFEFEIRKDDKKKKNIPMSAGLAISDETYFRLYFNDRIKAKLRDMRVDKTPNRKNIQKKLFS